jgi:hypothetical protein
MSIFTIKVREDEQPGTELMGHLIVFKMRLVTRSEDGKGLFDFDTYRLFSNYEDDTAVDPVPYKRPLMTWAGALQQCALRAEVAGLRTFYVSLEDREGPVKIEGYPDGATFYSAERNKNDGFGGSDAPEVPVPGAAKDHRQIAIELALEVISSNPETSTPLVEQIAKILKASATSEDETANPVLRKFLKACGGLAQPTGVDYPFGGGNPKGNDQNA